MTAPPNGQGDVAGPLARCELLLGDLRALAGNPAAWAALAGQDAMAALIGCADLLEEALTGRWPEPSPAGWPP